MNELTNGNCVIYFEQYEDYKFVHFNLLGRFSFKDFRWMMSVLPEIGPVHAAIDTGDDKLIKLVTDLGFEETTQAVLGVDGFYRRIYLWE